MTADRSTVSNVLLCVADQWRGDALGALGTPGVETPNLDQLAADGVLFANHWCQASPCGPSRSSLLTGTHLPTHGQWTNVDVADHGLPTIASALRRGGVTPVLVGYTDTPQPRDDPEGGAEGWRRLVDPDFEVALPFIWQHGFPTWRAELARRGYDVETGHPFGLYAPRGEPDAGGLAPAWYEAGDSDVAFLTGGALAVIDGWGPGSSPSLLHLNWLRPHPPMTAPRPYHRLVDPEAVGLPLKPLAVSEEAARHPYFELAVPGRSMTEYLQRRCRVDAVGEREDRMLRAAYYGLCAEVDANLGRVVEHLKRSGRYDTTLIVFTSDHGDALGDHWLYGRQGPFDGHFRVPCIVRDPRPSADGGRGTTVEDLTANVDLFPTICDALGLDAPETVEGASLVPHLEGTTPPRWRRHVSYDMSWDDHLRSAARNRSGRPPSEHRFSAVRTARHRLVSYPTLPPLLFDLDEDPAETTDRAGDPALASVRDELTALLSARA